MFALPEHMSERPKKARFRVDPLQDVLHAVRIQPQVFRRETCAPPYHLSYSAAQVSGVHLVEQGTCWLSSEGGTPLPLGAGDLVVVSNTRRYALLDAPDGAARGVGITLVQGEFRAEQNIVYPIFSLLPPLIHVPSQNGQPVYWLATALGGIASEAAGQRPGYTAVISRLMDVLFIMVMRSWIDQQRPGEGGWLSALYDPQLGKVLHAVHADPGHDWSLETLARIATMSRSVFVERFTTLVGEPPMKYLTRWRVQLATTWLGDDAQLTIEQMARRLGYASPFAFSKAFKRLMRLSPTDFRRVGKTPQVMFGGWGQRRAWDDCEKPHHPVRGGPAPQRGILHAGAESVPAPGRAGHDRV